jgi:hypothetical protein
MFNIITNCRICKNPIKEADLILDLGVQALTGVFPAPNESVEKVPVTVIKCSHCGLVQLLETVEPSQMFGDTYGYASALNKSMVKHLATLKDYCISNFKLKDHSIIVDIGSNDGTLLREFKKEGINNLLGIDPSAIKYKENYKDMLLVKDFFSKENYRKIYKDLKADLVCSIACFYDLEDPVSFAKEVADILSFDGKWVVEAAYLPDIIEKNCFDGCCQEHLSYYSLTDLQHIAEQVGLFLQDVSFDGTNGGSFRVVLGKDYPEEEKDKKILKILKLEQDKFSNKDYFLGFTKKVIQFKQDFVCLLNKLKIDKKRVCGLGASTKFNVLLQYCSIDTDLIISIGDVNPYKFGRVTPGTHIPIYNEDALFLDKEGLAPDYLVVGPYHFIEGMLKQEKINTYLNNGGKLIVPLPEIKVYPET